MNKTPSVKILEGIDRFFDDYVGLCRGDGVVVCVEQSSAYVADWLTQNLEKRVQPVRLYAFDKPDDDAFARQLAAYFAELRDRHQVRRIVVVVCEANKLSFSGPLYQLAEEHGVVVRRLIGFSPALFEQAFNATPEELRLINASLLTRLMKVDSLRIISDSGTDLEVEFDHDRYKWVSNHGIPDKGELVVLPAGEINTFPASISGVFVTAGALNYNYPLPFDARLDEYPITFEIDSGEVCHFSCDDSLMQAFLEQVFSRVNARKVGELGFGTNIGIDRWVSLNSHINERHAGVHLGFGEHGQPGVVEYHASVHLDAISSAEVLLPGDGGPPIDMSALKPEAATHPSGTHCEDLGHSSWRRA